MEGLEDEEGSLCKEVWWMKGDRWKMTNSIHCYQIDPKTGFTLPAITRYDGERNRDDKDPKTGLPLPAFIKGKTKWWYKDETQYGLNKINIRVMKQLRY